MTATIDLRERLRAGETVFGTFLNLGSPLAAELCARAGFDWLVIDLEHGAATEADLLGILHAVGRYPVAAIVRPQSGERLRIGRALDAGADGIMVPRLDTPDEVREAVSFLRFPPDGVRGVALLTRGSGFGEVAHANVASLNERILGVVQVESRSAVDGAADVAAIDGVDVLFVGPTDLSHSLGVPGRFDDATYLDALRSVVAAAESAGKAAGILLRDGATLPKHRELGFRFIGLGSDGAYVQDGARSVLAAPTA
ncbi:MAG: HpcH/HpaI aldolase family protein [Chloroflexota bacterium]